MVPQRRLSRSASRPTSHLHMAMVNYSALPRSGLPGPRLLRAELPVSVSEHAGTGPTAFTRAPLSCGPAEPAVLRTAPDFTGDFPLQAVRSVPLLPNRHSATTDDARLLSRLNNVRSVVSIFLPSPTTEVVRIPIHTKTRRAGAVSPPCSRLRRSPRKGGLAPSITAKGSLKLVACTLECVIGCFDIREWIIEPS
jgi:hypothetical protein